jgi:hypothetical protein
VAVTVTVTVTVNGTVQGVCCVFVGKDKGKVLLLQA